MAFSAEELPPGSIAFLKADAHECYPNAFVRSGLHEEALGHPTLILGFSSSSTAEDLRVWIMVITSSVTPPRAKHLLPIRSSNPLIHNATDIFHNSDKSIFHANLEACMPAQSYVQPRQIYDVSTEMLRPFGLWTPGHFTLTEQSMLNVFNSRSLGLDSRHRKLWEKLLEKYQDYNAIERHESDADWSPTRWIGRCFWLGPAESTQEKNTPLAWLTPCICIFLQPIEDSQDCVSFPILATDRLIELEKARSRYLLDRRGLITDYRKSESKLVHKSDTRWVTRGVECKTNFLRDFAVAHRALIQVPMDNLEYLPEAHPLHSFSLPEADIAELYEILEEVSPLKCTLRKTEISPDVQALEEEEILVPKKLVQSKGSVMITSTASGEESSVCDAKGKDKLGNTTETPQLRSSGKSSTSQNDENDTTFPTANIELTLKVKDLKIKKPLDDIAITIKTCN